MDLDWGEQRRGTAPDGRVVVWWERGLGEPVVLVHGFPDGPWAWNGLAERLAGEGGRVVAPFLRGYHPETILPGRPCDPSTLGEDVLVAMDVAGIARAAVVGHDFGASAAYAAAALAPDRVRSVVAIGIPHPRAVRPNLRLAWAARHFLTLRLPLADRLAGLGDAAYVRRLYRRWAPTWDGPLREAMVARMVDNLADEQVRRAVVGYYGDLDPRSGGPASARTPVPGLVVGGRLDLGGDTGPFEATPRAFDADCRVLLVDDAGHWPHLEQPGVVGPAVSEAVTAHG